MIVDAYVTRPIIGGGNLDLVSATYQIEGGEGIRFGDRTWRKNLVDSPFVHGSFPVTQVMQNSTANLVIRVKDDDHDGLETAIAALVDAFSQFEYEVHISFDSEPWAWTCWAADIGVGSMDERMAQWNVPVTLAVPRAPIPIYGGI